MTTVLTDFGTFEVQARPDGAALWIGDADLPALTGYERKPEGACRDDVCVPLREPIATDGRIDVAAFWRHIGGIVLHESGSATWLLAPGAADRAAALASLEAPDFSLPDLDGAVHSLSDFRGKKVLLATWASW